MENTLPRTKSKTIEIRNKRPLKRQKGEYGKSLLYKLEAPRKLIDAMLACQSEDEEELDVNEIHEQYTCMYKQWAAKFDEEVKKMGYSSDEFDALPTHKKEEIGDECFKKIFTK
jgi:hypothetical protein